MARLDIQNLTKKYSADTKSEIIAIDEFSANIKDGEFIVLVGPSGCGKSTILRCIAGLESVTNGTITLKGKNITQTKSRERDIAMVFQNYALYPHMTARANIGFGLKMNSDMESGKIDKKVEETSRMMGIEKLLDKKPGELSGGQQQRVALGRAIVRQPAVFLMDEPLSNLDAKLRTQMRTEIQNIQQSLHTTTIYVTHDQTEAMTMGDRIVILNNGNLQQIGTPVECYTRPANIFVASFIGSPSMNFFEVIQNTEAKSFQSDVFNHEYDQSLQENLCNASETITLGIRPEDFHLADEYDENTFSVNVNVLEYLGDRIYIYFTLGDQTCVANINTDQHIEENKDIDITFSREKLHIFDTETGEAIDRVAKSAPKSITESDNGVGVSRQND